MQKIPNIHNARCDADIMYSVLYFPSKCIDELLDYCIQALRRRYGSAFNECINIQRMITLLQTPNLLDYRVKQFALMFILYKERDLCDAIAELYDEESPFNVFGVEQFQALMLMVDRWVPMTLNFPYSEANVSNIVSNFVEECSVQYLTGTYH